MSTDINSAWEELRQRVSNCTKCEICKKRKNTVFGEGDINSGIVIIGEAPGKDEDLQGRPFVGKAGDLLTNILEKGGGIPRKSIYITNTIKCRPPDENPNSTRENRPPTEQEKTSCYEYLEAQLLLLNPKIIVTMGAVPTKLLLNTESGITSLRGKWRKWRGVDFLPMFHPSFLLHNKDKAENELHRRLTWQDVISLKAKIDEIKNKKE